jgi:hypothetical protein
MNGILQVKASVVSTGNQVSAEISTTGIKAKPLLDLSKWERADGARQFRPLVRKAEKFIAANKDIGGDIAGIVRRIKEALLLKNIEQADELREELLVMFDVMEKLDKK